MERNGGNRNTEQRYNLQHREFAAVHSLQFPRVSGERHGKKQAKRRDLPLRHSSRMYVFLRFKIKNLTPISRILIILYDISPPSFFIPSYIQFSYNFCLPETWEGALAENTRGEER